jgi:F0F1-type ATP synthase assembly protein I
MAQSVKRNTNPTRELRIGREMLDTTWRISVPVVLFACLGIVVDRSTGSRPWMTLLGMVIGLTCAVYLIKKQLNRWPDLPVKPGSYERNRRPGDKDDDEDKDYYND